ncbi:MAG TPA: ATP-binding protein [Candidatus Egerieicola pullicola]|uniref:ATP-binding protein n=1 Tax=Candidatus Egerieicola pullicola TaxID=2840775 RepID=A0A9D1AJK1_9FIRM|nr:ATP-binding protein [Candidatus Egerieicola pullicola]
MIKLIVGSKGSGKTKTLISMCNDAVKNTDGCVVCIEKAMSLQFSIVPQVRLIHADAYSISGYDEFYGFISGVLAGNYDIKDIFVDGILRIGNRDLDGLGVLLDRIQALVKDEVTVVVTVSTDVENLPASVSKYLD